MKLVEIEFCNIQSHKNTKFSLHPGLNFILADDNNVGKSTIFKVLTFATRMPNVSNEDALEILRVREERGYASFKFGDDQIILWLFRESVDKVRYFFEQKDILGNSTRTVACPQKLLDALDLVRGDDGFPINLNDADSVQLVVQDTSKNDEVLSKVLIDLKVEDVRKNLQQLSRQIVQDYRYIKSKHEGTTRTLASLHYNDSVDFFKDEEDTLNCAVRVMDALDAGCNFSDDSGAVSLSADEIEVLDAACSVEGKLSVIDTAHLVQSDEVEVNDADSLQCALRTLRQLEVVDTVLLERKFTVLTTSLHNASVAVSVLNKLISASISTDRVLGSNRQVASLVRETEGIKKELDSLYQKIQCPVKGEVYYNEEGCIPSND